MQSIRLIRISVARLHQDDTLGRPLFEIRLLPHLSFREKPDRVVRNEATKKGANVAPFLPFVNAAFAAICRETISASRTGTTCAPWRGRTSCARRCGSRG